LLLKGFCQELVCNGNLILNSKRYVNDVTAITIFFLPAGGKKPRIVANKIAKTDFLQERH
jgi:hypothetical protein